jgi:hypothetical protein
MFKLLKDLTRPPVSLAPPPQLHDPSASLSPNTTYTPRQRSRSLIGSSGGVSRDEPSRNGVNGGKDIEVRAKVIEETGEEAKRVVELLKSLEAPAEPGYMYLVEVRRPLSCSCEIAEGIVIIDSFSN